MLLRSHGVAEFTVAYLRFIRYACTSYAFLCIPQHSVLPFTRPYALTNAWQAADVEGLEDHLGQFVGDGEYLVRTIGQFAVLISKAPRSVSLMTVYMASKTHGEGILQVCFGCSLHDVALYRFTGLHECSQSECDATPAIRHNVHFSRCADAINCSTISWVHLHSIFCSEQRIA